MAQKLTVVVTGSTGKQGGAVARVLLERGHKVRAVTRDPNSSQAQSLANAGATLVTASLEDTEALTKALEGATSLFAMTTPAEGTYAEAGQGVAAADAAKAAGVHLVFTSVGSANRQTGVPHFDSKYEVEMHIAKVGVRATILAPVYFMENLHFAKEQLAKGIYAATLPPTSMLAQVAVADIRRAVAVRVLEDAGRFTGKRFDLASDELTGNDIVAILSRVIGRPFTYYRVLFDVIRQRDRGRGRQGQDVRMARPRRLHGGSRRRCAASFPTSPSTTSSVGRRRRIGKAYARSAKRVVAGSYRALRGQRGRCGTSTRKNQVAGSKRSDGQNRRNRSHDQVL